MFAHIEERVPINKIVTRQIEESILNRELLPGTKLPSEFELSKQFGVSRTAIREALKTLLVQNMIVILKGKGIFVKEVNSSSVIEPLNKYIAQKLDRDYFADLVSTREIIEPALAEAAALNRTNQDIQVLREDYNQLLKCENNHAMLAKLDIRFHIDIAKASHNQFLPLILEPIILSFMPELKSFIYETVTEAKKEADESHKKILDAIISGEPEMARLTMVEHLKLAEVYTGKMLAAKYGTHPVLAKTV